VAPCCKEEDPFSNPGLVKKLTLRDLACPFKKERSLSVGGHDRIPVFFREVSDLFGSYDASNVRYWNMVQSQLAGRLAMDGGG